MSQDLSSNSGLIDEALGWLVKVILRRWMELGVLLGIYCSYLYLDKRVGSVFAVVIIVGVICFLFSIRTIRRAVFGFLFRQRWQHKLETAVALSNSPISSRIPVVQKAERKSSSTRLTLQLKSGTTMLIEV